MEEGQLPSTVALRNDSGLNNWELSALNNLKQILLKVSDFWGFLTLTLKDSEKFLGC